MCNSNRIKCYGMIHHQFSGRLQGSGCQILSQEILQDPATSNIYVQIEFKYAKLVICRKKSRYDMTWRWDKTYSVVWGTWSSSCLCFHTEHSLSCVIVPQWGDNGAGHVTRDSRDNTNYSPSITINYRRLKTSGRHILMSLYIINWSLHCLVMTLCLLSPVLVTVDL